MKTCTSSVIFVALNILLISADISTNRFPDDFLFGLATSAFQIEGAYREDGKSESNWDHYTHSNPHLVVDHSNADIASDSYHKYEEDVTLLKNIGAQFYRFSISWPRIIPNGFDYKKNEKGIMYYRNLLVLLKKNNIIPIVTLFHWDAPQYLEYMGGFTNELMVDWFEQYARVAFEEFGDLVKFWITFNQPKQICIEAYGSGIIAPGYNFSGIGEYICGHNLLKAHARAYHVYDKEFRNKQEGKIGITMDLRWFEPAEAKAADIRAAYRYQDFMFGWFADPIYSQMGDYPKTMKDNIKKHSKLQGFKKSRLPEFTEDEINYIKGTYDYFGMNHYTSEMVRERTEVDIDRPSHENDAMVHNFPDPNWQNTTTTWLKVVPWGFRKLLNYIKARYGDIDIYIFENGFADSGEIQDYGRIDYYKQYLTALLDAITSDGVQVKAYSAWSLIDNFEWMEGYSARFGIHHVDFTDPNRTRTPKASAAFLKSVFANRKLPEEVDILDEHK